ncbi:MAG: 50S ribosomal protein L15 [Aigarchaeota archaeon]|nr:50S ribosomal protein L15 [Aigarchaeota archaeon]MDW8092930.1 uL15 family ribosomal protein [Nitrososphaerota archaeon]
MPTRLRKVRRLRGSRTHGWGQIGQHRKHGAKGGRGLAGGHKHKWTWVIKYAPDHFGEKGFHPPTSKEKRAMTINELDALARKLSRSKEARYEGDHLLVDLSELGVDKLVDSGTVNRKLKVIVDEWSKGAEEKLSRLGCILVKPGGAR